MLGAMRSPARSGKSVSISPDFLAQGCFCVGASVGVGGVNGWVGTEVGGMNGWVGVGVGKFGVGVT